MFNWFDLMRQAQASAGFNTLTRQFQLSDVQSQRAMAAFMPAFMMGLQHAMGANDPSRLMQSFMRSGYQNFWQAAGFPLPSQSQQEGRQLLDQLFGSDEVSRRVAHQAADYAGISADTMQQLLPLFAGILAGGVSHWMTAQAQAIQGFASPTAPGKESSTAANPWADLWAGWMKAASPDNKSAANPFQEMMTAFLQPPPAPKPEPEPEPEHPSAAWSDMMEKGREAQAQYLASLQSIFQDAWGTTSKKS